MYRPTLAALLFGLSLATPAMAAPAVAPAVPLPSSSVPLPAREQVQAYAKAMAARRAALPAAQQIDSTPPVLQSFQILGDVQADRPLPAALAQMTVQDDLSGLQTWIVTLVGPSGQTVQRVEGVSTGQKRLQGRFSIGAGPVAAVPFSRFTEPGEWVVDSVLVSDAAFNLRIYDRDMLAAMGRSRFTVTNTGGHDAVGPRLLKGAIETRQVSLSAPPPGTWEGTLPVLSVGLRISDEGNGKVSGPADAIAAFCLPDLRGNCIDRFEVQGHVGEYGAAKAAFRLGGQPRPDQTPGRYVLYYVVLFDQARNMSYLGSDTDFTRYFPSTTVTISP